MRYCAGFDVGKDFHWLCVLDDAGETVLSERVDATEEAIEAAVSKVVGLGGERVLAVDIVGGPATLLETVLLGRGEKVFHVPGLAVNRAREAYRGGEHKSDPRDARTGNRRSGEDAAGHAAGVGAQRRRPAGAETLGEPP